VRPVLTETLLFIYLLICVRLESRMHSGLILPALWYTPQCSTVQWSPHCPQLLNHFDLVPFKDNRNGFDSFWVHAVALCCDDVTSV